MTGMLASVNTVDEALWVFNAGVDIIDLKEPANGALGALEPETIATIVKRINGECPISATIGDLPLHPEAITSAVNRIAKTGVDYIKIGFFPEGDPLATLQSLAPTTQQNVHLIAVFFADHNIDLSLLPVLKKYGFYGAMIDTADKKSGSLCHISREELLRSFINECQQHQLFCGLAGSLSLADIPYLTTLNPDYLGFRGALCHAHQRTEKLDPLAFKAVKEQLNKNT
jgi:(5-formylfuran-3-yl)methyl phosphate synthase